MAILFGTTADGETLPVEVNEFGQLIAEGIPGQEGPPGPPGLPELPPDPFEGAILGWKDNMLSWLGGAVPLPPGTYGPIIAYQDGVLTLESAVDLPYLTRIDLTDSQGAPLFFSYNTSLIADVVTEESPIVFDQIYNPDDNTTLPDTTSVANGQRFLTADLFAKYTDDSEVVSAFDLIPGILFVWRVYLSDSPDGPTTRGQGFSAGESKTVATWRDNVFNNTYATCPVYTGVAAQPGDVVAQGVIGARQDSALTFIDTTNFERFSVGDVVQSPDVRILSISAETARIVTTPGSWRGINGTGTVGGETRLFTSDVTGTGTVQSCLGDTILLREDNGHWAIGGYVTTPPQNIAARYVHADELRKKLP